MTVIAFDARLESAARGGALVTIPPDVYDALGGSGRIPVTATFDGVGYRGSVVRMGDRPILGVLKARREELGIGEGNVISVTIQRDDAERTVDVPSDLAAALRESPEAKRIFEGLSYTHQREYVRWIDEAKRVDTRERRIRGTIDRLIK